MAETGEVRVPKLNANDTTYLLVQWLVTDGQQVSAGDPVAVVETSKAAEELTCDQAGYVQTLLPAGAECGVGQAIARLHPAPATNPDPAPMSASESASESAPDAAGTGTGDAGAGVVITEPARQLLTEHGIDPRRVRELGRRVVRREDVQSLLDSPDESTGDIRTLPRIQQAVAATVTETHRTVPAAFVAVKVRVSGALALARRLSKQHRCLVGLPELVVKAVAAQHAEFPLCFAHPVDRATVRLSGAAHVGVTVDVGGGLQVPVVHHAAGLDWRSLATTLMDFRVTALRSTFRPADLAGGTITVALHNDQDVTVAVPLVFPGQVCAVSLGGTQTELALADSGEVTSEKVVQLGLGYDHRVINGSDAVAFLQSVKALLGAPERLETLGT